MIQYYHTAKFAEVGKIDDKEMAFKQFNWYYNNNLRFNHDFWLSLFSGH